MVFVDKKKKKRLFDLIWLYIVLVFCFDFLIWFFLFFKYKIVNKIEQFILKKN